MKIQADNDSPLAFPCEFPIKVIGVHRRDFENEIAMIARRHIPDLGEGAISSRPSRNANYLAITIRFIARSREQLDRLYQDLNAHPDVRVTL